MPREQQIKLLAGGANPELAQSISEHLDVPLSQMRTRRFSDGEQFVEIQENVRAADVFVVQPTSSPVNENLMELLLIIDALKRASAQNICAVMPYYGYARQDRKVAPRTPISAKLVCDLLTAAGANRVLALDLHAGQIQGFFDIPFDHIYAMPVLLKHIKANHPVDQTVIVSPDAGGVERARAYAKRFHGALAIIDKRRPKANVAEIMNIIGDVEGKHAIIVDDMIDTAGTITAAAGALLEQGASSVDVYASHGVLSGPAIERINASSIQKIVVTDSIPLHKEALDCSKIEVLSVAGLLAKAIRRIYLGESVSSLFL